MGTKQEVRRGWVGVVGGGTGSPSADICPFPRLPYSRLVPGPPCGMTSPIPARPPFCGLT